ncbi:MAG: YifB family Mg chelatase-like AAA ATPase [Nitrospinota bacterium]
MLAKVLSAAVLGIEAYEVEVEVDLSPGLPAFTTVGLPDAAVKESRDRVAAAVKNTGFQFPLKKITVNLAPANVRKEGSAFDLPIAVGILRASGVVSGERLEGAVLLGELSLDGRVKAVKGALPVASGLRGKGVPALILPRESAPEAAAVAGDLPVLAADTLPQVVGYLNGEAELERVEVDPEAAFGEARTYDVDLSDIRGQQHAKRAMEVACAGGHNILMIGPPGSGKSMLAQRIPTILPELTLEESIETSKIHSVMGLMGDGAPLVPSRPYRAPHHTISDAGLIGGGSFPMPGEVSLAHNGVLFLDELPEFRRNVLEVLRQPLEEGWVTISRATASVSYPGRFMLAAAMNPCPCGYLGDPERPCACTPLKVRSYRSRVSGPLLDRIDIHIEVPRVPYRELSAEAGGETSETVRGRVNRARGRQRERFQGKKVFCNAHMGPRHISRHCGLGEAEKRLLETAMERLSLSARAYHRILKVARTIADLGQEEKITTAHLAEAIQYRSLDREISL